jgi:hypothetical protein
LLALAFAVSLAFISPSLTSAAGARHPSPSASPSGTDVVSFALAYVGYPYAYMGDTPGTGFSCTGFVHWVYSHFGYSTPEDPYALFNAYPHVAASNLLPGDVLLFANTFHPGLSHAAIYIGGGQMVGADNFAVGVHVDWLWDSYWGPRFVTGVRIAPWGLPSQNVQAFSYTRPAARARAAGSAARIAARSIRMVSQSPRVVVGPLLSGVRVQVTTQLHLWIVGLRHLPRWIARHTSTGPAVRRQPRYRR